MKLSFSTIFVGLHLLRNVFWMEFFPLTPIWQLINWWETFDCTRHRQSHSKTHNSFVQTQWEALEESKADQIRKQTGKNVDGPSSENFEQSEVRTPNPSPNAAERRTYIFFKNTKENFQLQTISWECVLIMHRGRNFQSKKRKLNACKYYLTTITSGLNKSYMSTGLCVGHIFLKGVLSC